MVDRNRDTPPTGTAVPRPRPVADVRAAPVPEFVEPEAVKPPENPTLEDIWRLIDARVPPDIKVRLSSIPPSKPEPPRQSMPVRAAKATGRWTKWAMTALGVLALLGEVYADLEKYRGPVSQLVVLAARALDEKEAARPAEPPAPEPSPEPEPEPEPEPTE